MDIDSPTLPESRDPHTGHDTQTSAERDRKWYQLLGPGLITGASDDDPSGIVTYAQTGAIFAYRMLWVLLFTWPLMAAVQEISARIGRVTGRGLAGNMRRYYARGLVIPIVLLLVAANVINLGADIAAMGACATLVAHRGSPVLYATGFVVLSLLLQIFLRYATYTRYLKWLGAALLVYVATAFFGHVHWRSALIGTFIPRLHLTNVDISMLVAIIGTTISPYLFFWQASLESEDVKADPDEDPLKNKPEQAPKEFSRIRLDTCAGMALSNLIGFFIMLTMAVTIGSKGGNHEINSAAQAAGALGQALGMKGSATLAIWLFSLGVIGTGMLAVPVLAGSAAYAVSEAMRWGGGLDDKVPQARGFYIVLITATLLGLGLNFFKSIDPMQALVGAAIINGVVAAPVMVVMMLMACNRAVMGEFSNLPRLLWFMGWLATGIMALTALGMLATLGR